MKHTRAPNPKPQRPKAPKKKGTPPRPKAKASAPQKVTVATAKPRASLNCKGAGPKVKATRNRVTPKSPKAKTPVQSKSSPAPSEAKAPAQPTRSCRRLPGLGTVDKPTTSNVDNNDVPELAMRFASPASACSRGRPKPLGVDAAFSNIAQRQAADAADSSTAKSNDNKTSDGKVVSLSATPKAASVKAKLKADNVKTEMMTGPP